MLNFAANNIYLPDELSPFIMTKFRLDRFLSCLIPPTISGFAPTEYVTRNGERWSTARAYLQPAARRPNLHVVHSAFAMKVIACGCGRVCVEGGDGWMWMCVCVSEFLFLWFCVRISMRVSMRMYLFLSKSWTKKKEKRKKNKKNREVARKVRAMQVCSLQ